MADQPQCNIKGYMEAHEAICNGNCFWDRRRVTKISGKTPMPALNTGNQQPGPAITCKSQLPLCSLEQEANSQNKATKKHKTNLNVINK